jgi:hypothetical protein
MVCLDCQNRFIGRTLLPLQITCWRCNGTGDISDEEGNCMEQAFNVGLRSRGIATFQFFPKPSYPEDVKKVSKHWGLKILEGDVAYFQNEQVLVIYKPLHPIVGAENHAVFASDIEPFLGRDVDMVIYGWEDILTKEPYVL